MTAHGGDFRPAVRADAPGPLERIWLRVGEPETLASIVGTVLIAGLSFGFFEFAGHTNPDTWVPVLVAALLILISLPICVWAARGDRRLRRWLVVALLLKLAFSGPRYYVIEGYYKGEGDALRYNQAGAALVQNMAHGHFSIKGTELDSFPRETRVVGYMTGLLYLFFGTSYFGGYLVFSWLAWLGMLMSFRAFQIAYPNAPPYRALALIMFLPSMLFWPSSLGKDAVMVFLVGLMTLGAARLLTGRKALLGIVWVGAAGFLMLEIRPHLLLISAVALVGSQLAKSPSEHGRRGLLVRLLVLAALVPVLVSGFHAVDSTFGNGTTNGGIDAQLEETVTRTAIGGSAFAPTPVRTPLDVPAATISVLYRPFLFEVRSFAVLISALEGSALLVMTILAARWVWRVGQAVYRSPFGAFCGTFVLGFIIAFSNIANAGILSRQRTQMFPALMILVAAAYEIHRTSRAAGADVALDGPDPTMPTGHLPVRSQPEMSRS